MNSFLKINIKNSFNPLKLHKGLRQCFFFALFLLAGFQAKATHIVGGEITYRCLGNNQYEIILTVYRDCFYGDPNVGFDDPAWLGFYRTNSNLPVLTIGTQGVLFVPYDATDTLDEQLTSECNIQGQDVCVHRAVYRSIVTLPQIAGGYTIVYQRCCRNETLQNIVAPLNTGAVFSIEISEQALAVCNSSPRYEDWPPIYVCANKPLNYDHSAIDDDGDSLFYHICTPFESGDTAEGRVYPPPPPPFDEVVWAPGFDLTNLLGNAADPLRIGLSDGLIEGTPTIIGQFLVAVCVDEFRDGMLLSRIRRDFQYNVRDCSNPTMACFEIPDTLCNSTVVNFTNCSVSTFEYKWTFYDAQGGILSTSTDFEPTISYPDYGTYRVVLIASDGPACIDTMDREIVISPTTINANFSLDVPECGNVITIQTTNTSAGGTNYQWYLIQNGNQINSSTDFAPAFTVDEEGPYIVVLIAYHLNGCADTTQQLTNVKFLGNQINPDVYGLCIGESAALNPNGDPGLQYTWSPTTYLSPNGNVPNPTSTPLTDITYFVEILDPVSGCSYNDTVTVTLGAEPGLDFDVTNDCGVLLVNFINNTNPPLEYVWDFGDGIGTSTDANPTYTYLTPGSYWVKLNNTTGSCFRVDSQLVEVNYIDIESINDSISVCGTDTVPLNPNGDPTYSYVWEPADKIIGSNTVANPSAIVDGYTVFTVQVSDPTFDDCFVTGRVAVDVTKLNMVNATEFVCEDLTTTLGITITGGSGTPTIVWSPDDSRLISGQGTTEITVLGEIDQIYTVDVSYPNGCVVSGTATLDVGTFGGDVIATISADSIYDAETVQLNVVPGGLTYSWSPPEGLSDPNIQNPIFTPPGGPGNYSWTVTVTQEDQCVKTSTVPLVVRETRCDGKYVFLPNAFSPNGDTRNETLKLYQDGIVDKLNTLIIYNRFGQEVYSTTDLNFSWNGTFNGKELDADVYGFYMDVLCIDGQQFKVKGNITLIK